MKNKLYQEIENYLANTTVLMIKLKNIHWNVTGVHFKMIHDYKQELFEHFNQSQDTFAELLKSQQQEVVLSLKNILEQAKIKERESAHIDQMSALDEVHKDLNLLKNQLYHARGLADVDANYTVASLLEDEMIFVDKQIWFVEAMQS